MTTLSRRHTLLALASAPWWVHAQSTSAPPPEIGSELPNARLQGQGRLTFWGLSVYNAKLWVHEAFKAENFTQQSLALELEYARSLVGKLIAERSLTEMRKVGEVPENKGKPWLDEMTQIIPDVNAGDRITGVFKPADGALRFFLNGKLRGQVQDAEFAKLFISIWLSPRTSEPQLRLALLGTP